MSNVFFETLASSSAHGISRAASTQSTLLRVAWILLFLCFLGLFCNNGVTLLDKIINVKILTVSEIDKVPFQFPDVYFCPVNEYSGSFPYTLNETEAALVNNEVDRLGRIWDTLPLQWKSDLKTFTKKFHFVTYSLSSRVKELLLHREEQSVNFLNEQAFQSLTKVLLVSDRVCFRLMNKPQVRPGKLDYRDFMTNRVSLFTDPENEHWNFTGHSINPIVDRENNVTHPIIPVEEFGGYEMVLVPEGEFPMWNTATSLRLSPGQAYFVEISMDQVAFSKEFHGKNCSPSQPNLDFVDPLSGNRMEYKFSYWGCYLDKLVRLVHSQSAGNIVYERLPIPWDLRDSRRWYNLSGVAWHSNEANRDSLRDTFDKAGDAAMRQCESLQPCVSLRYKASYSSLKYPTLTVPYSQYIKRPENPRDKPAMDQLARMAEQLDSGAHSIHKEATIRNFLSDSMIVVGYREDGPRSPQLLIVSSYSWTAFLADIGGLLGLYIGCSLLTLCELFEHIYHLMMFCANKRSGRNSGCQDQAPTVMTA